MNDSIGGLNHSEHFAAQAQSEARAASLRQADSDARAGRADEAEQALEHMFHKLLVKEMRKGLGDGFFGTGPGADTYADWFDDHLAEGLTESDAIDLAPLLEQYRAEVLDTSSGNGDDAANEPLPLRSERSEPVALPDRNGALELPERAGDGLRLPEQREHLPLEPGAIRPASAQALGANASAGGDPR